MTFTLRMRGTRTASSARTRKMRMLIASEHERLFSRVLLCQPMAPSLPLEGNGDFGTSPFFGQLLVRRYLPVLDHVGCRDVKHNGRATN